MPAPLSLLRRDAHLSREMRIILHSSPRAHTREGEREREREREESGLSRGRGRPSSVVVVESERRESCLNTSLVLGVQEPCSAEPMPPGEGLVSEFCSSLFAGTLPPQRGVVESTRSAAYASRR